MHLVRTHSTFMRASQLLRCTLTAMLLACVCMPALAVVPASEQLARLDQQLLSGRAVLLVSQYPPASAQQPRHGTGKQVAATLLFERPDRFRLVLQPGRKSERRFVGNAGKVRWLDVSSGRSGSASAEKVVDPLALILLGTAGELPRYAALKEVFMGKPPQPVTATILRPRAYGTHVVSAVASFGGNGIVGLDFTLADGSRVFVAVLYFKANVTTKPSDFELE